MSIKTLLGFSFGPIAAAFIGLISVPIVTRLVIPEIYAQISLVQVTIQLLLFACLSGLDQGFVREFYEIKNKKKLLAHTFGLNIVFSCFILFGIYVFVEPIGLFLFGKKDSIAILLLAIILFQSIILRYIQLTLRMKGAALSYSMTLLIQSIVNLILIVSFIKTGLFDALHAVLAANLASITIVIFVGITSVKSKLNFLGSLKFDRALFNILYKYSAPLFLSSLLMWVLYSADQYMLRGLSDFKELGLYSAAYKLCAALTLLQVIISTYWVPVSLKWAKKGESKQSYERVGFIVSFTLLILFLIIILSKNLLILLLGEQYLNALYIFPYLLMYPIYYALAEIASVGISISRKTKVLVPITLCCALVNVLLNYFFIPMLGAKGAAITTALTFLLYFYLRLYWSNKVWKKLSYSSYNYISLVSLIVLSLIENVLISYITMIFMCFTLLILIVKERKSILYIIRQNMEILKK